MTRKVYKLIASCIKGVFEFADLRALGNEPLRHLLISLSEALKFDVIKFEEACKKEVVK